MGKAGLIPPLQNTVLLPSTRISKEASLLFTSVRNSTEMFSVHAMATQEQEASRFPGATPVPGSLSQNEPISPNTVGQLSPQSGMPSPSVSASSTVMVVKSVFGQVPSVYVYVIVCVPTLGSKIWLPGAPLTPVPLKVPPLGVPAKATGASNTQNGP